MARLDLRNQHHRQLIKCMRNGARCRIGRSIISGSGFFYNLIFLCQVHKGMSAYDEELFGPVAAIIEVKDKEHVLRVANDSKFRLGAAIFTRGFPLAEKLTSLIQAGNVYINSQVRSGPRFPFGGVKESGFGRKLSIFGIREFVNIKTIYCS